METKKNKDGSYTVSGELKWTDTRKCRTYEYSEEMKEDLLKLAKKKEEKGLFLGELDHFVGGLPNFGGQTAIRSESTSNDVLSLAKVSHKCKNIRIEENTIITDITPLKTKEGTPGDILQTLLDAEFEFRPVVRTIGVPGEPGEVKITDLISVDLVAIDKEHREPWHQPTKKQRESNEKR